MDKKVLWTPQKRQAAALSSTAFELLYGGAAGGGKTDFLLVDYISGVNEWGAAWRGVLFRKTYSELEEIIKRGKELYIPVGAKYIEGKKTFIFPNGANLKLRYLEQDKDVTKYQGHQYTWAGFDELGNYAGDYCWKYMISRLRSAEGAPCYIRGTANPGGAGHSWIKARFIDGYESGKVYRDGETGMTRVFIPAKVYDNKKLMENDPGYADRLKLLPGHLRRALLEGDWDVFAGQVFDEWKRCRHVVKPFPLAAGGWYKFYALDWGYSRPYAIVKLAVNRDGKVIQYGEIYGCDKNEVNKGIRKPSGEAAREAWADAVREGVSEVVCDPAVWNRQDDGPSVADIFEKTGFRCIRGNNDRVNGWLAIHERLQQDDEYDSPMLQIFDCCVNTIRTLPAMTPDPSKPEDVDTRLEDHLMDALRYGIMSRAAENPLAALRKQNGRYTVNNRKRGLLDYNGF
jgi:hypothetical protein